MASVIIIMMIIIINSFLNFLELQNFLKMIFTFIFDLNFIAAEMLTLKDNIFAANQFTYLIIIVFF